MITSCTAKERIAWNYTSIPPYVFMAWSKYSALKLKAQELKVPTNKTSFSCMLTVTVGIIFRV
jgi:hypothetical protein